MCLSVLHFPPSPPVLICAASLLPPLGAYLCCVSAPSLRCFSVLLLCSLPQVLICAASLLSPSGAYLSCFSAPSLRCSFVLHNKALVRDVCTSIGGERAGLVLPVLLTHTARSRWVV